MGEVSKIIALVKAEHARKMQHLDVILHGEKKRIDDDYPMHIRIGCILGIAETPFILAGDDLKIKYPGRDNKVELVGRFEHAGMDLFRFYLQNGPEESMLFVARDQKSKQVIEAVLFRETGKVYPCPGGEDGDWPDWTEPGQGLIGSYWFGDDDAKYDIVVPSCPGDWVKPISVIETITADPIEGGASVTQRLDFAIYARKLGDDPNNLEKLFLSKVEDAEGPCVQIWTGLPIDFGTGTMANSGFITVC